MSAATWFPPFRCAWIFVWFSRVDVCYLLIILNKFSPIPIRLWLISMRKRYVILFRLHVQVQATWAKQLRHRLRHLALALSLTFYFVSFYPFSLKVKNHFLFGMVLLLYFLFTNNFFGSTSFLFYHEASHWNKVYNPKNLPQFQINMNFDEMKAAAALELTSPRASLSLELPNLFLNCFHTYAGLMNFSFKIKISPLVENLLQL